MAAKVPTDSEVLGYLDSLSNWGRWGAEDELGTLNFITPTKRVQATRLVSDGAVVTCSRPITTEMALDTNFQVQRYMVDSGEGRDSDPPERRRRRPGAGEFIGMVFHGYTITHIDSLSHYSWDGKMYNSRPASLVTSREGAQALGIDSTHEGILTRGVLLDIPRLKGKEWLESDEPVFPEDLEAAERQAGVTVESGDVLLVRTGNYGRRLERGPVNVSAEGATACHVACVPWFHQREIAMLGTDTSNDVLPSAYPNVAMSPLHVVSLVALGLWLIDNCNLEDVARACAQRGRWEFMLCIGPLRLSNVTGTPVNPIAVF